jgi:hypothetical protein
VQVQGEDPVRAGDLDQLRHQLGGDGNARLVLAVLARVPVVRRHHRDPLGGREKARVEQDQELHQVLRRRLRGLDDEDIHAADVLVDLALDLAVRKTIQRDVAHRYAELLGHLFRERAVRSSGHQLQSVHVSRLDDRLLE